MQGAPRSDRFDDVYFSAEDGPGETKHVFFDGNGLPERWQGRQRFCIAETGFGTGLNFLLTCALFQETAPKGAFLDFISVEKFPLTASEIEKALSPWAVRLSPWLGKLVAQYPLNVPGFHRIVFDGRVALTLVFGDANDVLPEVEGCVDAWFLDGFTPAKNPDMWSGTLFSEMARLSAPGATFATFTAAGFVKRGLREAGFHVEKRKGFGSKRDMLAGHVVSGAARAAETPSSNIAILGAGLAGCAAAYILPQYGIDVTLHDPNGTAAGASGNPVGLINPRLTAFRDAQSDFHTAGFALAARTFPHLADIGYAACGSLHLITDADREKRLSRTVDNWGWDAAHMRLLDAEEASDIAGVALDKPALYLPDAARLDPSALCRAYAAGVDVTAALPQEDATFLYACGAGTRRLFPGLPLQTVRGQITLAAASGASANLKTNICYGGYVSPASNGVHAVGSTFQKWLDDTDVRDEDDASNLGALAAAVPSLGALDPMTARAALRVAAKDRFPVVGRVTDGRGKESFLSAAHGSHGILSSLAAAHLLADMIRGGPLSLSKSTVSALAPARFAKAFLPSGGKNG